jgi:hypothetical protein
MKLKSFLKFLGPTLFAVPCMANTVTVYPGSNVNAVVANAQSGETIVFASGTYYLNSPLQVTTSGVTLTGVSPNSSHIVFSLPGGAFGSYGIVLGYTLSNVTIENLDLVSNHGVIQMSNGSGYNNTTIAYNNIQYGPGQLPDGTLVFGISGTVLNNNLQIVHNYMHDSTDQNSRNWNLWYLQNSNVDYNLFYNIEDGGQLDNCLSNVSFSHNYGTHIHRMGQEAGLFSQSNITFNGNVFYDWVQPYPDSDALSIVGPSGTVNYINNFFQASVAPGSTWGSPDGGGTHRFGLAIEGTGQPANVTGNTFVGTWACDYSSTMVNAQVWNNTVWGGALWGDFTGEPGPYGYGSVVAWNNNLHSSSNGAPPPPANTYAGPLSGASSSSAPVQSTPPPSSSNNNSSGSTSSNNNSNGGGALSGSQSAASSSYYLTQVGSSDWAHWGRGGNSGNFDHKASGNSQISNVSLVGSGGFGGWSDSSRGCSWSDGSPTGSDGGDSGYIWANNNLGAGYSFTVPAGTGQHTVYVYCGGYSSGSTLKAHLSDSSAPDYTVSSSGSAHYNNVVAITYHAASNNQTLTITYTKSQTINGSGGSTDLIAAWLQ